VPQAGLFREKGGTRGWRIVVGYLDDVFFGEVVFPYIMI